MQLKMLKAIIGLSLISFVSCSQNKHLVDSQEGCNSNHKNEKAKVITHKYGGWYCPDNLNGFAPIDIKKWESVPVVNDRLPTREETHTAASLIYVDTEKYPNAKVLDMQMPRLARYYSKQTRRDEYVIVIQAINVDNDSIVGFRYLNGGNGSSRLSEVQFLNDAEINMIPASKFVTYDLTINATQDVIWKVLTDTAYTNDLQPYFDKEGKLKSNWRTTANVNYHYYYAGASTASYANILFGNYYVQNDYLSYNEKFLLLQNEDANVTELKIVCGPFTFDYEAQKANIIKWAQKVKLLSE